MNVQHWLLLLSATARIRPSSQPPLLPSRSRRRMPLQCPWVWRRQPILPHPLPSIHARVAVTLHDARGIPTRLVNPITPEDTRDSGSCFAAGLEERGTTIGRDQTVRKSAIPQLIQCFGPQTEWFQVGCRFTFLHIEHISSRKNLSASWVSFGEHRSPGSRRASCQGHDDKPN